MNGSVCFHFGFSGNRRFRLHGGRLFSSGSRRAIGH
jgi:hypothetical protein